MANKWNLNNPIHMEKAREFLFSLPDDEEMSDIEIDDGAQEELDALDNNAISQSSISMNVEDDTEEMGNQEMLAPPNEIVESFQEDWNEDCYNIENISEANFRQKAAPSQTNMIGCSKAINYFDKLFDNDIIENIVEETNRYAHQKQSYLWMDTSVEEIRAFIGVLIIMGIHQLPHLKNYWSSDPFLGVPAVSEVMTENLHVNDNDKNTDRKSPEHDELHKLRPLIDKLNDNCAKMISPSSYLTIDESMIPFKGRSSLKQYMPMKPVKRGYKVWCMSDSSLGYILKFDIYTGKSVAPSCKESTLGERVVLKLTENISRNMHVVLFDNFFTSSRLLLKLISKGIFACGTVRTTRKDIAPILKSNTVLQRGEFEFQTRGPLAAIRWMDNKPVNFLTTIYSPRDTTTILRKNKNGKKEVISCPLLVYKYNKIMGGVDLFDQYREGYAIGRRSIKWWHRIMYYLIDIAIVNGHLLSNIDNRKGVDQLSFRISLARQLIGKFCLRKRRGRPSSFLANKARVPEDIRLESVGKHMPLKGESYRRCRLCSVKGKEKRTKCMCKGCDVPLCLSPCFDLFHQK